MKPRLKIVSSNHPLPVGKNMSTKTFNFTLWTFLKIDILSCKSFHFQISLSMVIKCVLSSKMSNERVIGNKSMQITSAYEEPRSSGKRLHEYTIIPYDINTLLNHFNVIIRCQQLCVKYTHLYYKPMSKNLLLFL